MTLSGRILQCRECGDAWRWSEMPGMDELVDLFAQHQCNPSWLRRHRRAANLALHHTALAVYLVLAVTVHGRSSWLAGIFYILTLTFFFTFRDAWGYTRELGKQRRRRDDAGHSGQ